MEKLKRVLRLRLARGPLSDEQAETAAASVEPS